MPSFRLKKDHSGDYIHTVPTHAESGELVCPPGTRYHIETVADGTAGAIVAASIAAFASAQSLLHRPLAQSPAQVLREALRAFKAQLSAVQLAELWYPNREPVETALADAAAGHAASLDAVKHIIRTLPWVAGRDDAIKAAALLLVGE